ncbi:hypothetical protein QYR02_03245 [Microbacterium maritypicum]|uniref:hypothetical protein n=1 Tax=Microbacterium TaxID=33882 RepID=UPI0006FFC894|nr:MULTISPECIES: hypothetical protein [Microbacterium]KQV02316.1 hypothetical protein ASC55_08495 [Microbacterium sp. Root322]WKT89949.1 hypothetical protein QYR02_03245 [Microbacterium liquefaciens]
MPHDVRPDNDVLWACVEEGFHVGSRRGDFLGYVDRQGDGGYRAFDARSSPVGDFATLQAATTAVEQLSNPASLQVDGSEQGVAL